MAYSDRPHRVAPSARMLALALALAASSCVWIDDFDKFKAMGERDAGLTPAQDAGKTDAAAAQDEDAGAAADAAQNTGKCADVDCSRLDSPCSHGVCNPSTGECESKNANDGERCFDDNPCTYDEHCRAGQCEGKAVDCSAWDTTCAEGVCDTQNGGCTFGSIQQSKACDDHNACSQNDRCTETGQCSGSNTPKGSACSDLKACTGTDTMPDSCDGDGNCISGGPVSAGASCDDDNTCTDGDHCDGEGSCVGSATREGEPCNEACAGNTRCHAGECGTANDAVPAFDKRCVLNFCGNTAVCLDEWKHDFVCYCGCNFEDADCNDCSSSMCQSDPTQGHRAERWCDQAGHAVDNCPDSLKNDGKCDCGCQFVDPDCGGGNCCEATGKAGCDDTFIESCVCNRITDAAPECCSGQWTQRCADLAVNLGCMACP
jgi:hypothetical protein